MNRIIESGISDTLVSAARGNEATVCSRAVKISELLIHEVQSSESFVSPESITQLVHQEQYGKLALL